MSIKTKAALVSILASASMWSEYYHPHKSHSNKHTVTPSTEGHKPSNNPYRTKDKEHRKQIRAKRNARRRRSRR